MILLTLAIVFTQLSILAFGGGNAILPEMQHQVVEVHRWLTATEFSTMFAMGLKMLKPILKSYLTILTIALTIVFMLIIKIPLALTLLVLVGINVAVLSLNKRGKNA